MKVSANKPLPDFLLRQNGMALKAPRRQPICIINVPIDLGAARRGTDAGPSAMHIAGLEQALNNLGYSDIEQIDIPVPTMQIQSQGDTNIRFKEEILAVCRQLAHHTYQVIQSGKKPLIIGGDHSIAMGSVTGVAAHFRQRGQPLGVIWFDAHGDMNLPETSPSGNIHGMPLAHLLGYGDADLSNIMNTRPTIQAQHTVLIGLRDIDPVERAFIHEAGVTAFTMRDIDQKGMNYVAQQALEVVNDGTAGFHLSFDVDGCDPDIMPGSGTLVAGGPNLRETHLLLEECANSDRLRSMDVVELNPFLDQANISAERAVSLVQSAFGRSIL